MFKIMLDSQYFKMNGILYKSIFNMFLWKKKRGLNAIILIKQLLTFVNGINIVLLRYIKIIFAKRASNIKIECNNIYKNSINICK